MYNNVQFRIKVSQQQATCTSQEAVQVPALVEQNSIFSMKLRSLTSVALLLSLFVSRNGNN